MYNRNGGKALAIPLVEFGNNNCRTAQKHDIVTAAKCVKGYHFMQTYLPKWLNSEIFEGYTPNCNNVVIERKQKAKKPNRNKLAM